MLCYTLYYIKKYLYATSVLLNLIRMGDGLQWGRKSFFSGGGKGWWLYISKVNTLKTTWLKTLESKVFKGTQSSSISIFSGKKNRNTFLYLVFGFFIKEISRNNNTYNFPQNAVMNNSWIGLEVTPPPAQYENAPPPEDLRFCVFRRIFH